jgi:hypothetical protein
MMGPIKRDSAMQILKQIWSFWKVIAEAIGNVIGRLVLTIFYFTLLMPFGLGVRSRGDPLTLKRPRHIEWEKRTIDIPSLDKARRLG